MHDMKFFPAEEIREEEVHRDPFIVVLAVEHAEEVVEHGEEEDGCEENK